VETDDRLPGLGRFAHRATEVPLADAPPDVQAWWSTLGRP
jgi:hypothetical protein